MDTPRSEIGRNESDDLQTKNPEMLLEKAISDVIEGIRAVRGLSFPYEEMKSFASAKIMACISLMSGQNLDLQTQGEILARTDVLELICEQFDAHIGNSDMAQNFFEFLRSILQITNAVRDEKLVTNLANGPAQQGAAMLGGEPFSHGHRIIPTSPETGND